MLLGVVGTRVMIGLNVVISRLFLWNAMIGVFMLVFMSVSFLFMLARTTVFYDFLVVVVVCLVLRLMVLRVRVGFYSCFLLWWMWWPYLMYSVLSGLLFLVVWIDFITRSRLRV